jgi:hypothetical protein
MANNKSPDEELVDAVHTAISTRINTVSHPWPTRSKYFGTTNYNLSLTSSNLRKHWFPRSSIEPEHTETIPEDFGLIWVVGQAAAQGEKLSRQFLSLTELQVTVGYQEVLTSLTYDQIAARILLTWQLIETCRLEVYGVDPIFTWTRFDFDTDENNTPFSYIGMRDANTFESFVTHTYQYILK